MNIYAEALKRVAKQTDPTADDFPEQVIRLLGQELLLTGDAVIIEFEEHWRGKLLGRANVVFRAGTQIVKCDGLGSDTSHLPMVNRLLNHPSNYPYYSSLKMLKRKLLVQMAYGK